MSADRWTRNYIREALFRASRGSVGLLRGIKLADTEFQPEMDEKRPRSAGAQPA